MRPYTRVISSDHTKTVEVDQVSNTIPELDNLKPNEGSKKEWEGNGLPFINPNEIENDSHLDEGSKE